MCTYGVVGVELSQTPSMISEALELYVEGRRFCHSWCMCAVDNDYGGLGEAEWRWRMVGMRDRARGVGHMSGEAGALPEWEVIH